MRASAVLISTVNRAELCQACQRDRKNTGYDKQIRGG